MIYHRTVATANESRDDLRVTFAQRDTTFAIQSLDSRAQVCVALATEALPLCGGQRAALNPKSFETNSGKYYASNACAVFCSFVFGSF
jgi:hypothetical protein